MAEIARVLGDETHHLAEPAPSLQLVRDTLDADMAPAAAEPNVGRNAMIGYVAGFIVSVVSITIAGTLAGLGFVNSLGIGSFVGMWGGGGFGALMGGTVPVARHSDAQAAHSAHRPRRPTPTGSGDRPGSRVLMPTHLDTRTVARSRQP
jgi:hypothetical protein